MEQHEAPVAQPDGRLSKFWLLLACIAAGVFFWLAVLPPRPGKPLKALSLEPLTFAGETVTLDDLKGKVVLLNFWGTWCPPCRKELPHIAELADRFAGNRDCRVLAVSCGGGSRDPISTLPDLRKETAAMLSRVELKLPTYADPEGYTRQAVEAAVGFKGYPTTIVLDPSGMVRGVWTGYSPGDEEKVLELVETLLAEV